LKTGRANAIFLSDQIYKMNLIEVHISGYMGDIYPGAGKKRNAVNDVLTAFSILTGKVDNRCHRYPPIHEIVKKRMADTNLVIGDSFYLANLT